VIVDAACSIEKSRTEIEDERVKLAQTEEARPSVNEMKQEKNNYHHHLHGVSIRGLAAHTARQRWPSLQDNTTISGRMC